MRYFLFSDTLYKDDVLELVLENQGKTHGEMAGVMRTHLKDTYPGSAWVVTVYDEVYGFNNHIVGGLYFHKLRYGGVNIIVTRFPLQGSRSPSPSISTIVGTISGSNAQTVYETIVARFEEHNETFTTIHVVRRASYNNEGLASAVSITHSNFYYNEFPDVVVIVVAPRYF